MHYCVRAVHNLSETINTKIQNKSDPQFIQLFFIQYDSKLLYHFLISWCSESIKIKMLQIQPHHNLQLSRAIDFLILESYCGLHISFKGTHVTLLIHTEFIINENCPFLTSPLYR